MNLIKKTKGFTLIELMVVIAIIGFLASVVLSNLNKARSLTQDSIRLSDMREIKKALWQYRWDNNAWPPFVSDACTGQDAVIDGVNWPNEYGDGDIGPCNGDDTFIPALASGGYMDKVPVDPLGINGRFYSYRVFSAGSNGCDISRGSYYVLKVHMMEANENDYHQNYEGSPGWTCNDSIRYWDEDADWVTGEYLN